MKSVLLSCLLLFTFVSFSFADNQIDINKATAPILAKAVKGLGKKRADAIIAYREAHGKIKTFEELTTIKGISTHTLEKIRAHSQIEK